MSPAPLSALRVVPLPAQSVATRGRIRRPANSSPEKRGGDRPKAVGGGAFEGKECHGSCRCLGQSAECCRTVVLCAGKRWRDTKCSIPANQPSADQRASVPAKQSAGAVVADRPFPSGPTGERVQQRVGRPKVGGRKLRRRTIAIDRGRRRPERQQCQLQPGPERHCAGGGHAGARSQSRRPCHRLSPAGRRISLQFGAQSAQGDPTDGPKLVASPTQRQDARRSGADVQCARPRMDQLLWSVLPVGSLPDTAALLGGMEDQLRRRHHRDHPRPDGTLQPRSGCAGDVVQRFDASRQCWRRL